MDALQQEQQQRVISLSMVQDLREKLASSACADWPSCRATALDCGLSEAVVQGVEELLELGTSDPPSSVVPAVLAVLCTFLHSVSYHRMMHASAFPLLLHQKQVVCR